MDNTAYRQRHFAITKNGEETIRIWAYSKQEALSKARDIYPSLPAEYIDAHICIKERERMTPEEISFSEAYAITHPTRYHGSSNDFINSYRKSFPFSERTGIAVLHLRKLPEQEMPLIDTMTCVEETSPEDVNPLPVEHEHRVPFFLALRPEVRRVMFGAMTKEELIELLMEV